jgi:DNA-directed RNA polymerase specialized sigma24 family protein
MTDAQAHDSRLVNRARAGDRDALEQLVQRHQGWVYNIAVRMLAHPHDAERPKRSSSRP